MKQIYDNQWSWKRKAILVVTDKHKIAASMNGMPHGGDGIPGNGFSGHFCVHFLDSSTHRSADPDLFHQFMVYTASGQRETFFNMASPAMLSEIFIGALSLRDHDVLKVVKRNHNTRSTEQDIAHSLTAEVNQTVSWRRKNQPEQSAAFRFEFFAGFLTFTLENNQCKEQYEAEELKKFPSCALIFKCKDIAMNS